MSFIFKTTEEKPKNTERQYDTNLMKKISIMRQNLSETKNKQKTGKLLEQDFSHAYRLT